MNKRGTLFDLVRGLVMVFFFMVLIFSMFFMINKVADLGAFDVTPAGAALTDAYQQDALPAMDYLVPALFLGIMIGSVILTFNLPKNPELFIYNLLLLGVGMILAVALANAGEKVQEVSVFQPLLGSFNDTLFVMNNMPIIMMVFGFVMIVMMLGVRKTSVQDIV